MMKVNFLKEAQEDYDALDGSQKKWVKAAVERLKVRGGEIGEPLHKSPTDDLRGCKKLKNKSLGLRIVFRVISSGECQIIEIIVIGKRSDSEVYHMAGKRLQAIQDKFKTLPIVMPQGTKRVRQGHVVTINNKRKKN